MVVSSKTFFLKTCIGPGLAYWLWFADPWTGWLQWPIHRFGVEGWLLSTPQVGLASVARRGIWAGLARADRSLLGKMNTHCYSKIKYLSNKNGLHQNYTFLMFKTSSTFRKCSGGVNHCSTRGAPCHAKPLLLRQLGQRLGVPKWATCSLCSYRIYSVGGEINEIINNPGEGRSEESR